MPNSSHGKRLLATMPMTPDSTLVRSRRYCRVMGLPTEVSF
jgi:hypothetical protein